jgi:hypothetical protein
MRAPVVLLLVLATVSCGGSDQAGPGPAVDFTIVLGTWTFQVQDNPACAGGGTVGSLVVQVSQTQAQVGFNGGVLHLENGTSTWSGGGQGGGYVTGSIGLHLPEVTTLNLVAGMPVNGEPPLPAKVATLSGAVSTELGFTGTLTDPNTVDTSYEAIFSTSGCTYQVTGHHG